jgi:enoyl-CoA hydratase
MSDHVHYALEGRTAVVRLDDGRANGLSPAVVAAVSDALDRAESEAGAVLITGREGRFSGGFDLETMRAGPDAAYPLVLAGGELMMKMAEYPLPIVAGCTGHAVAAGALLLLSSDLRLGAEGAFKIGLSEVAIGMTLPIFGVELARARISKRHFARATAQAELYRPESAVDAGYLDQTVPAEQLLDRALAEGERLAALSQPAFGNTKRRGSEAMVARVRASLEEDIGRLMGRIPG